MCVGDGNCLAGCTKAVIRRSRREGCRRIPTRARAGAGVRDGMGADIWSPEGYEDEDAL